MVATDCIIVGIEVRAVWPIVCDAACYNLAIGRVYDLVVCSTLDIQVTY